MATPSLLAKLHPYLQGLVALGKFDAHVQTETLRANRWEIEAKRVSGLLEQSGERIRKLEADLDYLTRWRNLDDAHPCEVGANSRVVWRWDRNDAVVVSCDADELPEDACQYRPLELPEGDSDG